MPDKRWDELGKFLVQHSLGVKKGEKLMIAMYETETYPLALAVYKHCIIAGGFPQIQFMSEALKHQVLRYGTEEQKGWVPEIEKYGMDEGMRYEPAKSDGYRVSTDSSSLFSSEFIEGCMMLEQPGDVSTPICSVGGVHIIKYLGDVAPGAVPLEEVRDTLAAEVLSEKQDASFVEQEAQWIVDADVKYYPERLQ